MNSTFSQSILRAHPARQVAAILAVALTGGAAAIAGPVTYIPIQGEVIALARLDQTDGHGHSVFPTTNGQSLVFSAQDSMTGPNPNGGDFSLLATSLATQRSQANAQGVSFEGSVAASWSGSNLYPDYSFDNYLYDIASYAHSQMYLSFFLSEATQFTFDASLGGIRDDNRDNSHHLGLYAANNFNPIAALNSTGSNHVAGVLQSGYYTVFAELFVRTNLYDGPSAPAAQGSFSLKFVPKPTPHVPEGGATWACLLFGLGLCDQLFRRRHCRVG